MATSRRRRSCKMNTMNLMMVPGLDNSKNLRAIRMESKKKGYVKLLVEGC